MPRLPDRVVSRMQPSSSQGNRLTANEVSSVSVTEARAVAHQAVDALENGAALAKLRSVLTGETVAAPLSSLRDLPAGKKWLDGSIRLNAQSSPDDVRVLQRALMKIGAHHPQGRGDPSLLLLPWGADGSLGPTTLKAVDSALRLAGREDLTPAANHLPLGTAVAKAIESLLQQTPHIEAPVPSPSPSNLWSNVPQRLDVLGCVALHLSTSPYKDRWQGVLSRIDAERSHYREGASGNSAAVNSWLHQLNALRGHSQADILKGVNHLVNATPYKFDDNDEWQTPINFINKHGDCEDYAIAKYVSLQQLGFDESRMRILIVRDTLTRQAHALLAVDMPDATYILDNQSAEVLRQQDVKLPPPDGRFMYEPMFAISRSDQWTFGVRR